MPALPTRRLSHRIWFFLAVLVLMLVLVAHSNAMIRRLNEETRARCDVLARFFAVATFQAVEDPTVRPIFRDVVRSIDFPVVLTDYAGIPRAWKEIGIPSDAIPDSVLERAAVTGVVPPEVQRIQHIVERLDRIHQPVDIVQVGKSGALGKVHYGEPKLVKELRWLPYLELFVILVLLLFGYTGLRSLMAVEQRSLWTALAKETAHQLGTPLSSLMGWTSLLRESPPGRLTPERTLEVLDEMDRDLARLQKVTLRFGQVGSLPVLKDGDLVEIVAGTVDYFRTRLPHLGHAIRIEERYEPVPRVRVHRELLEWVVENLLRNAMDAIDRPDGWIEVSVRWLRDERMVELIVRDNGRGMTQDERRRAFTPGYTTKRRGWGLGLALARRVVAEYHGGHISIVESVPGRGTAVAVALPVPPPPDSRATKASQGSNAS